MLIAAGLAGVYAESIPNFEVLTLVVFCSGVLLGSRDGLMVGVITELIYSVLNPYGAVHPLVTAAQVVGMAVPGFAGGIAVRLGLPAAPARVRLAALVVTGAGITIVFDFITNFATGMLFGQVRATLIGGMPFAFWHLLTNVMLFAVLGTPLVAVFAHYRSRIA